MAPARAIIYTRQSVDDPDGIARQIEDCTREAERRECTVIKTLIDNDESADSKRRSRTDYRPKYKELVTDVEAGACDVVIVQDQDRLLRDVREGEDLIDLVAKTKVRVVFTRAGEIDLATVDGQMHVRLKAVIARQETQKKAERQRRAGRQAAEKGELPQRRAFGYQTDGQKHPDEADIVRDAFDRLFRGDSVVSITNAMNEAGLLTTRGKHWRPKSVRAMLLNPRYAALRAYHGQVSAKGAWPSIIDVEEHEKAVLLLTDPLRKPPGHHGTARCWIGAGLYRCGRCGSDMRTGRRSYHNTRTYNCRAATHLIRSADPIDAFVLELLCARLAMDDAELPVQDVPALTELRQEASVLAHRLDVARDRLDRGVIDEDDFIATKKAIKTELTVNQRKMTIAAKNSVISQLASADDRVAAFMRVDLEGKRKIIDALMTVTVLPVPPGRSVFDPHSVKIDWK